MIELKNVKKEFEGRPVLKDVSLQVDDGDVVVILGPSGSGKTTFLRCINFLEQADGGELTIAGKTIELAKASKREILEVRRKTAFVFQNYNLFQNKTALENIMEGLVIAQSIPKAAARKKALEVLEWVGLSDKENSYPCQLSGGQQQRVASPEQWLSIRRSFSSMNRRRRSTRNLWVRPWRSFAR